MVFIYCIGDGVWVRLGGGAVVREREKTRRSSSSVAVGHGTAASVVFQGSLVLSVTAAVLHFALPGLSVVQGFVIIPRTREHLKRRPLWFRSTYTMAQSSVAPQALLARLGGGHVPYSLPSLVYHAHTPRSRKTSFSLWATARVYPYRRPATTPSPALPDKARHTPSKLSHLTYVRMYVSISPHSTHVCCMYVRLPVFSLLGQNRMSCGRFGGGLGAPVMFLSPGR